MDELEDELGAQTTGKNKGDETGNDRLLDDVDIEAGVQ